MKYQVILTGLLYCLPGIHGNAASLELELQWDKNERHRWEFLMDNPVDLNRASVAELMELPLMYPQLARRIVRLRNQLIFFRSIDQLRLLDDLSYAHYLRLVPLVTLRPTRSGAWYKISYMGKSSHLRRPGHERQLFEGSVHNNRSEFAWLLTRSEDTHMDYYAVEGKLKIQDSGQAYRVENVSFRSRMMGVDYILGNYVLGYGMQLNLNLGHHSMPHGMTIGKSYFAGMGEAKMAHRFSGMAMNKTIAIGNLENQFQFFLSHANRALFARDIETTPHGDIQRRLGKCRREVSQSRGFYCGADGIWHTTQILDSEFGIVNRYKLVDDAYRERLTGFFWGGRKPKFHFGLLGYAAQNDLSSDWPGVDFSVNSSLYQRHRLQVRGFFVTSADNALSLEYSSSNGFPAWLLVSRFDFAQTIVRMAARYYHRDYVNPYSQGDSVSYEAYGLTPRNEQGLRFQLTNHGRRTLSETTLDVWQRRHVRFRGVWQERATPSRNMYMKQKWEWSMDTGRIVGLQFVFNRDQSEDRLMHSETADDRWRLYIKQQNAFFSYGMNKGPGQVKNHNVRILLKRPGRIEWQWLNSLHQAVDSSSAEMRSLVSLTMRQHRSFSAGLQLGTHISGLYHDDPNYYINLYIAYGR